MSRLLSRVFRKIAKKKPICLLVMAWVFLFPRIGFLTGLENFEEIDAQLVTTQPVSVDPKSSVTVVVRVSNLASERKELVPEVILPEDWKLTAQESSFVLEAGQETIRLLNVFVPSNAKAGEYTVQYIVSSKDKPPLQTRVEFSVLVREVIAIDVQALEGPSVVFPGDTFLCRFVVVNKSNTTASVDLVVSHSKDLKTRHDFSKLRLNANESQEVSVEVKTESQQRGYARHWLSLRALASSPKGEEVAAEARHSFELISLNEKKEDGYLRIPMKVKLNSIYDQDNGTLAQLAIDGEGALDAKKDKRIDFSFRGPRARFASIFFMREEEYRLNFLSKPFEIHVGDRPYSLTRLTSYGYYGRGVEGDIRLSLFYLKGYYLQSLVILPQFAQLAFQTGLNWKEKYKVLFNYFQNRPGEEGGAFSFYEGHKDIFSIKTQLFAHDLFNVDLEYASGKEKRPESREGDAIWAELFGTWENRLNYHFYAVQSSTGYPGYYRDLTFYSGAFSFYLTRAIGINAIYHHQKSNNKPNPDLPSPDAKQSQVGLRLGLWKGSNLFADFRMRDQRDRLPIPRFNSLDRTIRAGTSQGIGPLRLYAYVDAGHTDDRITGNTRRVLEYYSSLAFEKKNVFSLGGSIELRNQDEEFTGERTEKLIWGLNCRLNLGYTSLQGYYRTGTNQRFYERILEDRRRADPFMLYELNQLDITLRQKLWAGHTLTLRLWYNSSGSRSWQSERLLGLVEYAIPIGFPVRKKKGFGSLKGRVFDAERQNKGIPGVIVRVNEQATLTDKEGAFVFKSLKPGPCYINLDRTGLGPGRITIQDTPLQKTILDGVKSDVKLGVIRGSELRGRIVAYRFAAGKREGLVQGTPAEEEQELEESHGLQNILVEIQKGTEVSRSLTDSQGRFRFDSLRPGRWTIKIYDDYIPHLHYLDQDGFDLELKPGESQEITAKVLPVKRQVQMVEMKEMTIEIDEAVGTQPAPLQKPPLPATLVKERADFLEEPGRLEDILIKRADRSFDVQIVFDRYFSHKKFTLSEPNRLVLDFDSISGLNTPRHLDVNEGGIRAIRVGQFKERTVRVVFDFSEEILPYRIEPFGKGLKITVDSESRFEGQGSELKDIVLYKRQSMLVTEIIFSGDISYRNFEMYDPNRIVLDIENVRNIHIPHLVSIDENRVKVMRASMVKPNVARVAFDLIGHFPQYKVEEFQERIRITFLPY